MRLCRKYIDSFLGIMLVRRYCGGSHQETFMQCLCMSLIFCMAAVFIGNCLEINYRHQIMVTVLYSAFMIFMETVKSKNRISLKNRDVIKITKKVLSDWY